MSKELLLIVINVGLTGLFVYLGLGPQKLWTRVMGAGGEISWTWLFVNIGLVALIIVFVVTSISLWIKSAAIQYQSTSGAYGEVLQKATPSAFKNELKEAASELARKAEDYFDAADRDFRSGSYLDAISNYKKSIATIPTMGAYQNLALSLLHISEFEEAERFFTDGLKLSKRKNNKVQEFAFLVNRSLVYFKKRIPEKAISDVTKAIELNPKVAAAYNNRGNVYYYKGDYEHAILDYQKALDLNPKFSEAYYNIGNLYKTKEDYNMALSNYAKALKIDDNYVEVYLNRANLHSALGNYGQAISDCNRALNLRPDYAEAYNSKGNAHSRMGDCDLALVDYNKAIEIKPNYADAYNGRGVCNRSKKEYDRAISDLTKALQLNPSYAEAYLNRGIAYGLKNEYEKAVVDFDSALKIRPRYSKAYFFRGVAHSSQRIFQKAIADYEEAVKINPRYAEAHFNLAKAYEEIGRKTEAAESYRKFIQHASLEDASKVDYARNRLGEIEESFR